LCHTLIRADWGHLCALQKLGRPLTAVEVDPRRAAQLASRTDIRVVHADS
jgi:hypothetical protein